MELVPSSGASAPQAIVRREMAIETGKSGRDRPNARAKASAARVLQRKRETRRRMLVIGGVVTVVLVVVVVMVIVAGGKKSKQNATVSTGASATAVQQVTSVPAADSAKVAAVKGLPSKVTGSPLTFDGKPGMLYIGADYCPYCAAMRWPLVTTLSRFGTWSSLGETTSASQDVFPSTPSFSFHGASFSSPYLTFQGVETQTNQLNNGSYAPLDTPTAAQAAIFTKYDAKGSVPFMDFGNKFVVVGATYDPGVLKGKSFDEIAADVTDPSTDVAKNILGTANTLTAAVCEMTGGKPGSVCDTPVITKLRSTLNAQ